MTGMNFRKKESDLVEVDEMKSDDNYLKKSSMKVERIIQFQSDTKIEGDLISPDSCCFNGTIKGDIIIGGKLVLGETSEVIGNVQAHDLIAKGKLVGNIVVENETVFTSCSTIQGDSLSTHFLTIETGAVLNVGSVVVQENNLNVKKLTKNVEFSKKDYLPRNEEYSKNDVDLQPSSSNVDNSFLFKMFQDQ